MMKRLQMASKMLLVLVATSPVAGASWATAQWDAKPETEGSSAVVAPQAPPAPGTPQASTGLVTAPPSPPPPKKKKHTVRPQWGVSIGVPIWLDVERDVVRPGAQLDFWGAADFGFVAVGGRLGFGWTPIELSNSDFDFRGYGREPLRRVNFSPELRLQIPDKKVLPYLSNAFDMNWWNFLETNVVCGWWYCSSFGVYRFSPGYTGRAGLGIKAVKAFHVDLGFSWTLTAKGDFFDRSYWIVGPYVGALFR